MSTPSPDSFSNPRSQRTMPKLNPFTPPPSPKIPLPTLQSIFLNYPLPFVSPQTLPRQRRSLPSYPCLCLHLPHFNLSTLHLTPSQIKEILLALVPLNSLNMNPLLRRTRPLRTPTLFLPPQTLSKPRLYPPPSLTLTNLLPYENKSLLKLPHPRPFLYLSYLLLPLLLFASLNTNLP